MSYINYKSDENSIFVCKGNHKNFNELTSSYIHNNLEILNHKNKFSGVRIKNFLSVKELDGFKCEEKFKAFLEKNSVPFLYIGQGPFGIERSGVLIEQVKSKRADFILNIPNMGTLLFDAKCRTKLGFKRKSKKYFPLFVSELKALYNLEKLILMPVWIAFYDRTLINETKSYPFHLVPISTLHKFWRNVSLHVENESQFKEIIVIRIPEQLLTKTSNNKIEFKIGYSDIDEKILKDFSIKNLGLNRKLRDSIKQIIREKNCYKSNITELMMKDASDYLFPNEIIFAVEELIKDNVIDYKPREFLRLTGE